MIDKETCMNAWDNLLAEAPNPKNHNPADFPTIESAHAEIIRLKEDNYRRLLSIHAVLMYESSTKPTKGRPTYIYEIVNLKNTFKVRRIQNGQIKKKIGRPLKASPEEKEGIVRSLDSLRKNEASINGKPITDKSLLIKMIDQIYRGSSLHKKQRLLKKYLQELKYYRDETSIRQKQKTPK